MIWVGLVYSLDSRCYGRGWCDFCRRLGKGEKKRFLLRSFDHAGPLIIGLAFNRFRFTKHDRHMMRLFVRGQGYFVGRQYLAVKPNFLDTVGNTGRILDLYPIHRIATTVIDFKLAPAAGDARSNSQRFTFQVKAEH